MAKEFLRTLCTKYLCDELCHKKWGKRVTPNSKGGTPWAKARSRCSPSVVPPPLYIAAAPFPKGGNTVEVLSQDVRSCADIFSLVLDLVCTLGRDLRGMGLRPLPRIPTFFILLTSPHPPPWPSFKVQWRGMRGQGRPI